jgi:hypothetical protein
VTKIPIVPDYNLIAAEFALGRVLAVTPLAGGTPDVAASNDCNTQQVGSSRGRHPEPAAGAA